MRQTICPDLRAKFFRKYYDKLDFCTMLEIGFRAIIFIFNKACGYSDRLNTSQESQVCRVRLRLELPK